MSGAQLAKVTVIIPCRNEAQHLENCLQSLLAQQEMSGRMEILVIDGRSEDTSAEIVKKFEQRYPHVRLIDNPRQTTPAARNIGIREASGDYICIVDARNNLSPRYLTDGIHRLASSPAIVCVGGQLRGRGKGRQGSVIALVMKSPFGVGGRNFRSLTLEQYVDTVAVPIYRTKSLFEVGLFDETLARNQDDDLNYRLRKLGGKILYFPGIQVEYVVRDSLKNLFQQYQQYGYWKVFVNRKHKSPTNLRQFAPPVALLIGGILLVATPFSESAAAALSLLVGLYASLALAFGLKSSTGVREFLMMPVAFATLHLGYGIGYLRGIWDFLILRRSTPDNYFSNLTR
jgi:GT2 family glycosyltransferase